MFAQYISRSKDQHRVLVQAGQSIQIQPDSDIIQILSPINQSMFIRQQQPNGFSKDEGL